MRILSFLLVTSACVPDDTHSFTLDDHGDALTDAAGDKFFVIAYDEGEHAYALTTLNLTVQLPGEDIFQINLDLDVDVDGDGAFGAGDVLVGLEPGVDLFGTANEGVAVAVAVRLTVDDPDITDRVTSLWSGDWMP